MKSFLSLCCLMFALVLGAAPAKANVVEDWQVWVTDFYFYEYDASLNPFVGQDPAKPRVLAATNANTTSLFTFLLPGLGWDLGHGLLTLDASVAHAFNPFSGHFRLDLALAPQTSLPVWGNGSHDNLYTWLLAELGDALQTVSLDFAFTVDRNGMTVDPLTAFVNFVYQGEQYSLTMGEWEYYMLAAGNVGNGKYGWSFGFTDTTIQRNTTPAPTPEPASMVLMGLGLSGLMVMVFRRRMCLTASRQA